MTPILGKLQLRAQPMTVTMNNIIEKIKSILQFVELATFQMQGIVEIAIVKVKLYFDIFVVF